MRKGFQVPSTHPDSKRKHQMLSETWEVDKVEGASPNQRERMPGPALGSAQGARVRHLTWADPCQ